MNLSNNIEFAKLAEGTKRLHNGNHAPYDCPAGYTTIGYGRNIQTNGISENEAERMLMNDLTGCVALLERNVKFWEKHNDSRQSVLIDMCFNMGWGKLSQFKKQKIEYENQCGRYLSRMPLCIKYFMDDLKPNSLSLYNIFLLEVSKHN